ncbi:hypothetical protein RN001_005517 [Aquatica leii]|uniref:DUF8207 domain-containing protein n=1 Tax=Aquatica leii TaxID=1421715 RepID=A0AAN7QKD8_9COLE|nr:hypothetical protein RN001_005517 [Aquatica leii]
MYNIFNLKPVINYRLELMQSHKLKEYYDNIVERVIKQKLKNKIVKMLIFMKTPNKTVVTENDKNEYMKILKETNVLRRSYDPNKQIQGNRTTKYIKTIKPLLKQQQQSEAVDLHTSGGQLFKKVYNTNDDDEVRGGGKVKPVEYRYWNNVHELMDELQVLWAEKQAGHTGHDNEIIAILEELYEDGYIDSLPKTL